LQDKIESAVVGIDVSEKVQAFREKALKREIEKQ